MFNPINCLIVQDLIVADAELNLKLNKSSLTLLKEAIA